MIDLCMRSKPKLNIKDSSQSALRVSVHDSENMDIFTQEAEQESKQTTLLEGDWFDGNAEQVPLKSHTHNHGS